MTSSNMKLSCLIVDDEPIAREILKSYVGRTGFMDVAGELSNGIEAFNFLQQHPVNLLFVDIKMPQMSGLELLRSLSVKPKVIITSAYRYYATDAFELDVADYFLKPYSFERFLKGVNKAAADYLENASEMLSPISAPNEKPFIFVKGNKQLQKVFIDDILYIESQRDYLKFNLQGHAEVTTRQTIAYYEQFLPASLFLRVHRSFIVAVHKISAIEANRILLNTLAIPIGRNYKQHVQEYFRKETTR